MRPVRVLMTRDELVEEIVGARLENMRLRETVEKATRPQRHAAEAKMTGRTDYGRKFEEHRCADIPRGWCLRKYGPEVGTWWTAHAPYVWEIVRVNHCDEWLDDEEAAAPTTGVASEPRFCPWCGAPLERCPDEIRGWRP